MERLRPLADGKACVPMKKFIQSTTLEVISKVLLPPVNIHPMHVLANLAPSQLTELVLSSHVKAEPKLASIQLQF